MIGDCSRRCHGESEHNPKQHYRVVEVNVEEIVIDHPRHQRPDHRAMRPQPYGGQRVIPQGRPHRAGSYRKETDQGDDKHGQTDQTHLLGDEQIHVRHADVEINIRCVSEANPKDGVPLNQPKSVLVFPLSLIHI